MSPGTALPSVVDADHWLAERRPREVCMDPGSPVPLKKGLCLKTRFGMPNMIQGMFFLEVMRAFASPAEV